MKIYRVEIKNLRSIKEAVVELQSFTLIIGENGAGKSNFIKTLSEFPNVSSGVFVKHYDLQQEDSSIFIKGGGLSALKSDRDRRPYPPAITGDYKLLGKNDIRMYRINPAKIGMPEGLTSNPYVNHNGEGVVRVLDSLKTGDREDLFDEVERLLVSYIPSIERLSFAPSSNSKMLQVRESYINKPVLVKDLSEGTRFAIAILTILHQENPPSVVCIEDIDNGIHPRLLKRVVELCFDITRKKDVQIIATTQNPYLVDLFRGNEESVLIAEKIKGQTVFNTIREKMDELGVEDGIPLGELWYSGLIGGVPE